MNRNRLTMIMLIISLIVNVLTLSAVFLHDKPVVVTQAIRLVDNQGHLRGLIGVSPDGMSTIALYDAQERERAVIAVPADGEARMVMQDKDHKPLW